MAGVSSTSPHHRLRIGDPLPSSNTPTGSLGNGLNMLLSAALSSVTMGGILSGVSGLFGKDEQLPKMYLERLEASGNPTDQSSSVTNLRDVEATQNQPQGSQTPIRHADAMVGKNIAFEGDQNMHEIMHTFRELGIAWSSLWTTPELDDSLLAAKQSHAAKSTQVTRQTRVQSSAVVGDQNGESEGAKIFPETERE